MRRIITSLVLAAALAGVAAAPVGAAKPARGCPNDAFTMMTYPAFRALSLALGVPEELLGPEHEAGWNTYDRNDDGLLCVMDLPDNAGTLNGWVFNAIDNTAHR